MMRVFAHCHLQVVCLMVRTDSHDAEEPEHRGRWLAFGKDLCVDRLCNQFNRCRRKCDAR
jgi:hypothetical protein